MPAKMLLKDRYVVQSFYLILSFYLN